MLTFSETQQNPYRWYVVLAVIGFSLSLVSWFYWGATVNLLAEGESLVSWKLAGAFILVSVFFCAIPFRKIETHIDQSSVQFKISLFGSKREVIKWEDIDHAYVREFVLYGEYPKGMGGTRQGPNGWAYVMNGDYGLQINKKSGGKILLGTQRPDELLAFLTTLPIQQKTKVL
ncbi:hypothetical protein [Spirosoma spitsbergense]|uniref:hypothetical protein n=1 Tax=Spirosoma spitsbergense TaxID=431554 RepID=UPI0003A1CDCA|nr:hypothetical protein [Spirosoma spitsbergense]